MMKKRQIFLPIKSIMPQLIFSGVVMLKIIHKMFCVENINTQYTITKYILNGGAMVE